VPRVLIVEDDNVIANAMVAHLRREGMDVEWSDRGERAVKKLRFERPDVAIIDLMLPGMDGWTIIETLRADGVGIPLIVISARGSEQDKVHALGIGGDDYLTKPFGMHELVARVKAAIRRAGVARPGHGQERVEVPGLVIDPDLHRVLLNGEDARLTRTEFRLLSVLGSERGRVLSRDQLQQRVWGYAPSSARPLGRRLHPQAAREARPALDDPCLHPHPLRRGLPVRPGAAGRRAGRRCNSQLDLRARAGRPSPPQNQTRTTPQPTGCGRPPSVLGSRPGPGPEIIQEGQNMHRTKRLPLAAATVVGCSLAFVAAAGAFPLAAWRPIGAARDGRGPGPNRALIRARPDRDHVRSQALDGGTAAVPYYGYDGDGPLLPAPGDLQQPGQDGRRNAVQAT
jgi:DNA-binding response OmpR family regulator